MRISGLKKISEGYGDVGVGTVAFGAAWATPWGSRLEPGRKGWCGHCSLSGPLNGLWIAKGFAGR